MARAPLALTLALLIALPPCAPAARAQTYVRSKTDGGVPTRWYTKCVPVYLNAAGSATLPQASVERAIGASLDAWSAVGCADLSLLYEGLTSRGDVGYVTTPGVQNINQVVFEQVWRHDPSALALTTITMCQNTTTQCPAGTIVDADIEVNEDQYTFATNGAPSAIDLENTLTHEVGHLIGFDHAASASSTMFAAAPPGETGKRTLAPLDERGACDVYPASSCLACELGPLDLSASGVGLPRDAQCTSGGAGAGDGEVAAAGAGGGCAQRGAPSPISALLWAALLWAALIRAALIRAALIRAALIRAALIWAALLRARLGGARWGARGGRVCRAVQP
ncbi:MAG: matrixin family metalloprotease [Deltaproteobacteria bacterium]|nr:matrixin family metalloprotease [Deltaproteobacteria bacterium]